MRTLFFSGLSAILLMLSCTSAPEDESKSAEEFLLRTNDGSHLFVKVSGSGPPCIFVHGGPGAWSKSFEELGGKALEEQFTMIYFDQRGSGRSQNAKDYRLKRMILDIEELRNHLELDHVFLMSHSFGGIIATNYARAYPKNLKGLILVNATLNIKKSLKAQIKYINELTGENITVASKDALLPSFGKARTELEEAGLGYKVLTDQKSNFEKLEEIDSESPSGSDFAQKVWDFPEYMKNYVFMTQKIQVPTLVIGGTKDHAVGVNHYKAFKFPNSMLAEIKGSHILYFEKNQEFIEAVSKFTEKVKSGNVKSEL